MKHLIVCADDYGLSPGVSLGIRQLAEAGRISATGAMTCMPAWAAEAEALKPLADKIAVGLHFTLTDQKPLGRMPTLAPKGKFPTVGELLRASLLGALPLAEIAAELHRQLDAFEEHFGAPPDFIDGHQHVHVFKGVRGVVLSQFHRRLDPARTWLRDCSDNPLRLLRRGFSAKAMIVGHIGKGLRRQAEQRNIPVNQGFSGFYDPAKQSLDGQLETMLQATRSGHLLMVHPGHVDAELEAVDSLTAPREAEFQTLMQDSFPARLEQLSLRIAGKAGTSPIHGCLSL